MKNKRHESQETIFDDIVSRNERLIAFLEYAKETIIDDFEAARIENPSIKAPDCTIIDEKIKALSGRK